MSQSDRSGLRADRGFYTQPIWAGLVCSSIYVLVTTGEEHRVSEWAGNTIAATVGAAAMVCLVASCLKDWRTAFRLEFGALLVIIGAFGVLDFAADVTLWEQLTFVGALAAWVQLGSIRLAWHLWQQLKA